MQGAIKELSLQEPGPQVSLTVPTQVTSSCLVQGSWLMFILPRGAEAVSQLFLLLFPFS